METENFHCIWCKKYRVYSSDFLNGIFHDVVLGKSRHVFLLDLSKIFGTVNVDILLKKLEIKELSGLKFLSPRWLK